MGHFILKEEIIMFYGVYNEATDPQVASYINYTAQFVIECGLLN